MKAALGGTVALVAIAFSPLAHADGNASDLDQIVGRAYTDFQSHCTPSMSPQFQRIVWDGGRPTGQGGTGTIIDATRGLGGPFKAYWNSGPSHPPGAQRIVSADGNGYWDIEFDFC